MNPVGWGLFFIGGAVLLYLRISELDKIQEISNANAIDSEPIPDVFNFQAAGANDLLDNFGVIMSKVFSLPGSAAPYAEQIYSAEDRYGIPSGLLGRLLYQESRFRAEIIDGSKVSPKGALGIAQFMPATAADLGIDPLNPSEAIPGAAKYLRRLFDSLGTWEKALAAYNWGIGNVKRKGLTNAPIETKNYTAAILSDVKIS